MTSQNSSTETRHLADINPEDYDYHLPQSAIAQYPLKEREASKLLVYKNSTIHHDQFKNIGQKLPEQSLLVFNDTKVIQARLIFRKTTGARIEIFCLEPVDASKGIHRVMAQQPPIDWYCLVGNKKKWPTDQPLVLEQGHLSLQARLIEEKGGNFRIRFDWAPQDWSFAKVLEETGYMPLPPYIKREAEPEDRIAYQTVYAGSPGAVAAPTAGLHFTDSLLRDLEEQGIQRTQITLHVGAGTFQPVQTASVSEHPMHQEQIVFTKPFIRQLLSHDGPVIPVGTTSLRALESLYWFGVALQEKGMDAEFFVQKLSPYIQYSQDLPSANSVLKTVLNLMEEKDLEELKGATELLILPGYQFKFTNGLITNFHQPKSTLLMLVAALVGADWHKIYEDALANNYRFLSYGDSSLLLP